MPVLLFLWLDETACTACTSKNDFVDHRLVVYLAHSSMMWLPLTSVYPQAGCRVARRVMLLDLMSFIAVDIST
jgi:hypothetical protein